MILHVILSTALSASAAFPADSVRPPARPGTARPDSTLLSLPMPTIRAPREPETRIAGMVALAWPGAKKSEPAPAEKLADKPAAPPQRVAEVVQQATPPRTAPLTVAIAAADASAVARTVAPAKPTIVAQPVAPAQPKASPAPEITSDGRMVVGTRSTVTFEPLHAVPLPAVGLRLAPPSMADSIVVYKRERTLTLFLRGVPVRSYFVALGSRPVGDKVSAGDDRTPEGLFTIDAHNPASKYHLALRISYPDAAHRAKAEALGVNPGGDIMVHGLPAKYSAVGKEHRLDDWTNGCVALSNQEIEEIWHAVPDGTPIQIKP